MHGYPAIIELGKPKQIFNQLFQSPRLSICNLYVLVLHLRRYLTVAGQQLQVSDDGCKGCAQVVGHIGYELVFGALRFPLLIHQFPYILHHLVKVGHTGELVIPNHINGGVQIAF